MNLPFHFLRPQALHIPDGFLSLLISIISWILLIITLFFAIRRTRDELSERQIPLMGMMAAFVFAAQMINFPVAGGTSGHFLGGALVAIVLGPWAGILVMTAVVGVQALLFQDGGLLVMGANILNMGVLTALTGYGLYRLAAGKGKGARWGLAGVGAWLSVMAAALLTSTELWLSGTSSARIVFPAMLGVHVLIGIGEALITVAALVFIERLRPSLLTTETVKSRGGFGWAIGGIVVALIVVLFSPFASANPDGLERVAEDLGFLSMGAEAPFQILPDYIIPALGENGLSTILAGTIGVLVVIGVTILIGWLIRLNKSKQSTG